MVTGRGPVTITDVARLAGVSPGTASKALNGRRGISARTAMRVSRPQSGSVISRTPWPAAC